MDPITAIAIASTAFNAIKKGIEFGRDVEDMSGDLGRWVGAMGDIRDAERNSKNPGIIRSIISPGSVEKEAMDAFIAKKKADAMEYELKTFINFNYGPTSWDQILQMQGKIRKARQAEKERQANFFNNILLGGFAFAIAVLACVIIYFTMMAI
jgi:hypothetical protein